MEENLEAGWKTKMSSGANTANYDYLLIIDALARVICCYVDQTIAQIHHQKLLKSSIMLRFTPNALRFVQQADWLIH